MLIPVLLNVAPLLALLIWAAAVDVRRRTISNSLTASLLAAGIAYSMTHAAVVSPLMAILGALVALAMGIAMFAVGAWGGGDAKLMAGVGAWLGPIGVLTVFVVAALVGMVIALVQATCSGKLKALVGNSAVIATGLANVTCLGVEHVEELGQRHRCIERPLPYAVPVLVATVIVLLWWGR